MYRLNVVTNALPRMSEVFAVLDTTNFLRKKCQCYYQTLHGVYIVIIAVIHIIFRLYQAKLGWNHIPYF